MFAVLPLLLLSIIPLSTCFQITIGVGKDEVTGLPGVGFDPSRTVATADGDTVLFSFLQGSHRVVQTSLENPCSPSSSGFDSGIQNVPNGTVANGPSATFTIRNMTEVFYFADIADNGGGEECLKGAVFCINTNEASATSSCHAFRTSALALGAAQGVSTSIRSNAPFSASSTSTSSTASSSSVSVSTTASTGSARPAATGSGAGRVAVGGVGWEGVAMALGVAMGIWTVGY